ncbi:hypothetical protein I312_102572 [Cryptococcus bacillisporus CA1280]|uniref:uncharacterized protein n=1 Tax=Cryptococcus bacillisporus CA1280 TaxID=1296109 RepID=UPI003367E287
MDEVHGSRCNNYSSPSLPRRTPPAPSLTHQATTTPPPYIHPTHLLPPPPTHARTNVPPGALQAIITLIALQLRRPCKLPSFLSTANNTKSTPFPPRLHPS